MSEHGSSPFLSNCMNEEQQRNGEEELIGIDSNMQRRTFLKTTVASPLFRGLSAANVASICSTTTEAVTAVASAGMPKLLSSLAQQSLEQNFGIEGVNVVAENGESTVRSLRQCHADKSFAFSVLLESLGDLEPERHHRVIQAVNEGNIDELKSIAKDQMDGAQGENIDEWFKGKISMMAEKPEALEYVQCHLGESIVCEIFERSRSHMTADIQKIGERKNLQRFQSGKKPIEINHPFEVAARAIVESFTEGDVDFNEMNGEDEIKRYSEVYQLLGTEELLAQAVNQLTSPSEIRDKFLSVLGRSIDSYMTASDWLEDEMEDFFEEAMRKSQEYNVEIEEKFIEQDTTVHEIVTSITSPWNRVLEQARVLGSETERPSTAYLHRGLEGRIENIQHTSVRPSEGAIE